MVDMRCTRPGCGGTLLDGYCDTCGLAAKAAPKADAKTGGKSL